MLGALGATPDGALLQQGAIPSLLKTAVLAPPAEPRFYGRCPMTMRCLSQYLTECAAGVNAGNKHQLDYTSHSRVGLGYAVLQKVNFGAPRNLGCVLFVYELHALRVDEVPLSRVVPAPRFDSDCHTDDLYLLAAAEGRRVVGRF